MPKLSLRSPLVVIVTVDALATAPLSCYGCSWNLTPEIDSMAARGTVWDRWTSPDDRPGKLLESWLSDSHEVLASWNQTGETVFVTDDATSMVGAENVGFHRVVHFERQSVGSAGGDPSSDDLSQTALGQAVAAVCDAADAKTKCLWFHTNALREHWDATEGSDDVAEDDAESEAESEAGESLSLPETTNPPSIQLSPSDDPDLPFAWMNRYSAQVRLLDTMIGVMRDTFRSRQVTFVLAGTSGFSLGENGWIGHHVGPLRSTDIRLPLIVTGGASLRVAKIQRASDFGELLRRVEKRTELVNPAEWCADQESFSPAVVTLSDRAAKAVTTPSWFYVEDVESDFSNNNPKLFLKPDDLCDVNDVSRLRRDVMNHFDSLDCPEAD